MTFNALFSPIASGADGRSCTRLDYRYRLIREGGRLVIDNTASIRPPEPCDTE
jgi:hypothetical protein